MKTFTTQINSKKLVLLGKTSLPEIENSPIVKNENGDVIGLCLGKDIDYKDIPNDYWYFYDCELWNEGVGIYDSESVDYSEDDVIETICGKREIEVSDGICNLTINYTPGKSIDLIIKSLDGEKLIDKRSLDTDFENMYNSQKDEDDEDFHSVVGW
jgi:hypothetical protein